MFRRKKQITDRINTCENISQSTRLLSADVQTSNQKQCTNIGVFIGLSFLKVISMSMNIF